MMFRPLECVKQNHELSFKNRNRQMTSGLVCPICSELLFEVSAALAQL